MAKLYAIEIVTPDKLLFSSDEIMPPPALMMAAYIEANHIPVIALGHRADEISSDRWHRGYVAICGGLCDER